MTPEEAYRILELPAGADPKTIQDAFRRAAMRTHPDSAGGRASATRKQWLLIRDAYECLREAGFPSLEPQEPEPEAPAPRARIGPKPYRAPDWLERKWAAERGDRLGEYLRLDEHESRALKTLLTWLLVAIVAAFALYGGVRRLQHGWSPKAGVSVRW